MIPKSWRICMVGLPRALELRRHLLVLEVVDQALALDERKQRIMISSAIIVASGLSSGYETRGSGLALDQGAGVRADRLRQVPSSCSLA